MSPSSVSILLFILVVLLPIGAALLCLFYSLQYLKSAWTLKETPPSKIRSAVQGVVELNGQAKPFADTFVLSKFASNPCVWYQYCLDTWQTQQTEEGPRSFWNRIEIETSEQPFILDDGTDECIIMPQGANIIALNYNVWFGYQKDPAMSMKASFGSNLMSKLSNKIQYRYQEYYIKVNDPIYATGCFTTLMQDDTKVQENQNFIEYLQRKKSISLNVLTPGLHQPILITGQKKNIVRKYQINALMFFVAFLFFCATITSLYPLVKRSHIEDFFHSTFR